MNIEELTEVLVKVRALLYLVLLVLIMIYIISEQRKLSL